MAKSDSSKLARRTVFSLLAMGLTLPLLVWGTFRALGTMNDDAIGWTPSDLPARRNLEWFADHFETPDSILVSWPGATLDDPRLERFARALETRSASGHGGEQISPFRRVVTGREMLDDLTAPPRNLPSRQAIERLKGVFVGPDGRSTCAVIVLSEEAAGDGRGVLQTIRDVAQAECGIDPDQLRIAGHLVETATIDAVSLDTLVWLAVPSAVLVILVAWPCLRSLSLTLVICVTAAFCQCLSLALIHFTGAEMNGMLAVMPILILVIFLSGAVHLVNYYREALPELGPLRAPGRALRVGWFPCSLAVVTSALGVGSLALSRTGPIRIFGGYTAFVVLFSLAALFAVLPGAMLLTSIYGPQPGRLSPAEKRRRLPGAWSWELLAQFVDRRHAAILTACMAVTVLTLLGLARIKGSMQLTDFFAPDSRIVRDHQWLEEHVGPLMPVEVVLQMDRDGTLSMVEKLELVDRVERAIGSMETGASTFSLATFLPRPSRSGGVKGSISRAVLNRRLEDQRDQLASSTQYLVCAGGEELWRITARVETLSRRRYEEMLAELEGAVDEVLGDARNTPGEEVSVVYAGMLPLLAESHPALIRDLGVSFGASLLLIAVVLMVGLRSVRLGLVSMLPNVFPITVVFGTMGWLGRSIDVGSMMTAAVGLGIAVDGTVHFLTWFTRGLDEGRSRQGSILIAYRRCAGAMLRTTAICGVGLAVYAASSFAPAARFGWIICVLLLAALVGDLLFLPALLCGPLGKVLFPRRATGRPSEAEQAPPPEARKAAARAICDCDPASPDFA